MSDLDAFFIRCPFDAASRRAFRKRIPGASMAVFSSKPLGHDVRLKPGRPRTSRQTEGPARKVETLAWNNRAASLSAMAAYREIHARN